MINLHLNSINCSFLILCFTYRCGRCTAALSLPRGGPEVRTLPPPDEVPSVSGRHSDQHWPRAGDLRLVYVCPHRLLLVIRNVCFKFNQMCIVSMILKNFVVLYVCFLLRKNVAQYIFNYVHTLQLLIIIWILTNKQYNTIDLL